MAFVENRSSANLEKFKNFFSFTRVNFINNTPVPEQAALLKSPLFERSVYRRSIPIYGTKTFEPINNSDDACFLLFSSRYIHTNIYVYMYKYDYTARLHVIFLKW